MQKALLITLFFLASFFASGNNDENISITADVVEGCEPLTVTFTLANMADPGASILWNFDDGVSIKGGTSIRHTFESGSYRAQAVITIRGKENVNCFSSEIKVKPSPKVNFKIEESEPHYQYEYLHFDNQSSNAVKYMWIVDSGHSISGEDKTQTFSTPGKHTVKLIATGENGCTNTVIQELDVVKYTDLYVPNVIFPNSCGGSSDLFCINWGEHYAHDDYSLHIYNRWGELIFETTDPLVCWDGLYKKAASYVEDGVYVWKVSFTDPRTKDIQELIGHVTVMR